MGCTCVATGCSVADMASLRMPRVRKATVAMAPLASTVMVLNPLYIIDAGV